VTEHLESLQAQLTEAIHRSARRARTEEDLKIGVEQALAPIRAELNITPSYETTYSPTVSVLGGGSSDAVYGHAIIEYKRPGRLATQPGQREATEELQKYLLAEANRYDTGWDTALRRMIGIALDDESIFFLRYRGARRPSPDLLAAEPVHQMSLFPRDDEEVPGFVRLGPHPVNEESVGLLVLYLRSLRRRALTPEALALEFGPAGDVARALVSAFNATIARAIDGDPEVHPKVVTLFREWDRIFGIVYGQGLTKGAERASELAALYGVPEPVELKPLLFAVHTYYAMLMKLLAAELASLQGGSPLASPLAGLQAMSTRQLRERLGDLENGGLFARFGVHNFLEGDFFGWYVEAWRPEFEAPLRSLARSLAEFEPATGSIKPEATRDLLKKLYQYLVPKQLRHDLGEYYTPDWLAELTLSESGYDGASHHRFLDPACGSGTCLVLAIKRALEWAEDHLTDGEVLAKQILANVVGFDLNPLAVIAARTNYLLALGTLIRRLPSVEIPVYLCDSVLTPSQQSASDGQTEALFDDYELNSTVGPFHIPRAIVAAGHLPDIAALLEECVQLRYEPAEFEARAREIVGTQDENVLHSLRDLFSRLVTLHREGRDGLWARLLKNAFAPIFAGRFHFVVGNPPWSDGSISRTHTGQPHCPCGPRMGSSA
jgi:SAM-dependent methyltransferase